MTADEVRHDLRELGNPERAKLSGRYFKTGPGQYGEGDVFLGLTTPQVGTVIKKYRKLDMPETLKLLDSPVHEDRTTAISILVYQFEKGDETKRKQIFDLYLANTKHINNWDLVDISAPKIVSGYLLDKDRKVLYKLAKSENLWERRIAIMGTFGFIRQGDFEDTLAISELLLPDKHDLIHKAVGWMLREVGKLDREAEEKFLKAHIKVMPRTMVRYAIEKFPEDLRLKYLRM